MNAFGERVSSGSENWNGFALQAKFTRAAGDFASESVAVEAAFDAGVDVAARFCGEDDPSFGLAEIGRS